MSQRKSLDEKIAALVEAKKAEPTDAELEKAADSNEDTDAVDESDAKHKRPADKDQKEKEEVSKVKQESADEDDDEEEKEVEEAEDKEDDEEDKEDASEEKDADDDEEDKEKEEEMKESDAKHKRKADKDSKEAADKLDTAKGQDSKKEVDPDNKKAYDYTQKKPNFSVKEDVAALFNGEDLSEEFKEKATTILEAAVNRQLDIVLAQVQEDVEQRLAEQDEARTKALTEQVSKYLDYVVDQWMEENKLAIERGYAIEATQDFISALKGVFQEHYIEVPDVPRNVLDELSDKNEELEKDLNEALNRIIDLSTENEEKEKEQIFSDATSELTDTQVEKFRGLAEKVDFSSADDYRSKLATIKENYFPSEQKPAAEIGDSVDGGFEEGKAPSPTVKAYADALSRTLKHKKL